MKLILLFVSLFLIPSLFAQTLVQKTVRACDVRGDVNYYNRNQLLSKRLECDTLYLNLGLVRNCHFSSQIDLSFDGDSLKLAITNTTDVFAACECYFEIELKISGIPDTNFTPYFNFEYYDATLTKVYETCELKQYSSKYIFPTPSELQITTAPNLLSSAGQRMGYWRQTTEKNSELALFELNEAGQSVLIWHLRYNSEGTIIEVCATAENNGMRYAVCIDYPDYLLLDL